MSKTGDIITLDVDPATNGGLAEAAALVTGVYDDGSLRLRVFGDTATEDTHRNYVDDKGEPFQTEPEPTDVPPPATAPEPSPPATAPEPSPPAAGDTESVPELEAEIARLSPEDRAALLADLRATDTETAPGSSADATPPTL